jgi:hypothetical protein
VHGNDGVDGGMRRLLCFIGWHQFIPDAPDHRYCPICCGVQKKLVITGYKWVWKHYP